MPTLFCPCRFICCSWEMVTLSCIGWPPESAVLARRRGGAEARAAGGSRTAPANYCAVVVRLVVLPGGGLCCAGLALAPSFLISFLASALPSVCLASAVLAPLLCRGFFLLGS